MTVTPLSPETAPNSEPEPDAPAPDIERGPPTPTIDRNPEDFGSALRRAVDAAGAALARADEAERDFVSGRGGLQEMVVERAQADVLLTLAGAAAARTVGALNTILGMQV